MNVPIVVFCYNRLGELKTLIASLLKNKLAESSDLYIYCDGPKDEFDKIKTDSVRSFVDNIKGFRNIKVVKSNENHGLAASVIKGVSEILETNEQVIVLEDDLILSENFLSWMNQALYSYKDNDKIFSVSGFSPSVIKKNSYCVDDVYFTKKAHSWGWGTWKNRWNVVDWDLKDWETFRKNKKQQKEFNSIGNEMTGLLFAYKNGTKSTWWARFCYSQFKLGKLTVYPTLSKVINTGFTSEATHCNVYNRYRVDFDRSDKCLFSFPNKCELNKKYSKKFYSYYSLSSRIMGKLKTIMMNCGIIKQYIVDYDKE